MKTFGLLQPYFGHLSCMPVVYVTRYKLQGMLPICLSVVEKLLLFEDLLAESLYSYSAAFVAFIAFPL